MGISERPTWKERSEELHNEKVKLRAKLDRVRQALDEERELRQAADRLNGELRKALQEIKETGYRANPYDNCARIAEGALAEKRVEPVKVKQ